MIRILYKNEYFDLAAGEKITVEWLSTVFNDDNTFAGSYAYPALAPFSPKNKRLLEHADQAQNRNSRKDIEVIVEIFGQSWKRCKCSFKVGLKGFNLSLKIDNGEFANLIKELTLPKLFINTEGGVFRDWVYENVGFSPSDVNEKMIDSARNPGKYPWVFPCYKNDAMFGSFDGEENQKQYTDIAYFNQYFPGPGYFSNVAADVPRSRFFTPFFYLRWVVKQVCKYLGYEATGDFFTDERTAGLIVYNTGVAGLEDLFEKPDGFKIKVAYHLPNIKVTDFIKRLRCHFKMAIYFDPNERIATFRYTPDVLTDADVVDISGKTVPGFVQEDGPALGYELIQPKDEKDDIFKLLPYPRSYLIGEAEDRKKVESFIGTAFMSKKTEARPGYSGGWRISRLRQTGNAYTAKTIGSEAYIENQTDYAKNEFDLRLLNYRGMKLDSEGREYPYASSDDLEPNETFIDAKLSLWLGGERGILASYQRDFYIFYLRTEQVELTAHLPYSLLSQMSPLKKFAWITEHQVRLVGLFNQVTFEAMQDQELLQARISVYPNYNQAATDEPIYTEFKPAEEVNPGGLYAKGSFTNRRDVYKEERKWFLGKKKKILTDSYVDIVVDFFADEACTIPKSVDNVIVYWIEKYRSQVLVNPITKSKKNVDRDTPFPTAANKATYTARGARWVTNIHNYHSEDAVTWSVSMELYQPQNADYIHV